MNCISCDSKILDGNKFCSKCGKEVKNSVGVVKKKKEVTNWIVWWRIGEDELKKQLDNYDSFFKSARGESLLLIGFSLALTLVMVFVAWVDPSSIYDVLVLGVLGIFIALGHRWAMIGAMILWSLEKGFQLINNSDGAHIVPIVIWWTLYMHVFWLAYKVEVQRKKIKMAPTSLS